MKKLIYILLLFFTVAINAQTPFPNGIALRNAQQTLVADSIPVMGANGKINSYISVSDLIGEGQITEQDNKIQVIDLGVVDINTVAVAAAINSRPNFTIAEDEIYYFSAFAIVNSPNQVGGILHTSVLNNKGKGTYGVGGEQLLSTDIRIIFQRPFINDISEIPSTQTINLGDVGSNDIVTAWNNYTFTGAEDPVQEQNEGYVLIDVIIDGEPLEYLFVGVGGNYGTGGNLTATIDDFVLLDSEVFDNRDLWRIASGSVGNDTGIPATLYTQPMRHGAQVFAPRFGPSGGTNNGVQNADTNWLWVKGNQGLNLQSINPNQGHVRVTSNGNLTSYALPLTKYNLRAGRNFNDNIVPGLDNYKFVGIEIDDVVNISTKTGADTWYAALRINPALSGTGKHYSILSERGDALFKTGTFTVGTQNNTTGFGAISLGGILTNEAAVGLSHGLNIRNRGFTNFLTGIGHDVRSMNVTVVGQAAEVIDEQILDFNATADKDLFVVGNGTIANNDVNYSVLSRSNAFQVKMNGEILAPSTTIAGIDNEPTGKHVVTREWVEAQGFGSGGSPNLEVYSESGTLAGGNAQALIGDFDSQSGTGSGFSYNQDFFSMGSSIAVKADMLALIDSNYQITGYEYDDTINPVVWGALITTPGRSIGLGNTSTFMPNLQLNYSDVSGTFKVQSFQNKSGTIALLDDITTPTLQQITDSGNFTTNNLSLGALSSINPFNANLNLNLGQDATSSNNFPFYLDFDKTNPTNSSAFVYGISNLIDHEGAGNISQLRGIFNRVQTKGGGVPLEIVGNYNQVEHENTSSGTTNLAIVNENQFNTLNLGSTGTITNLLGLTSKIKLNNPDVTIQTSRNIYGELQLTNSNLNTHYMLDLRYQKNDTTSTWQNGAFLYFGSNVSMIDEQNNNIRLIDSRVDLPSYFEGSIETNITNEVITNYPNGKIITTRDFVNDIKNKTTGYTVATLPAGVVGEIAHVTDAASITYRGVATGGGTDVALVMFDGTNWIYH